MQAACRVSLKASSSTTGDARVASYQAAINSVAARYYPDWPFMVEVLNKWLEMNQDFVRDPLGHTTSNPLLTPPSAFQKDHPTISTIRDASYIALTPAPTSDCTLTQTPSTPVDNPPLSLHSEAEVPECIADSSPAVSTSDLDDLPMDKSDVRIPIYRFLPLTWTSSFRFLPSLWNLIVGTFSSVVTSSFSRFKRDRGQY
jgi:hypothetical protein